MRRDKTIIFMLLVMSMLMMGTLLWSDCSSARGIESGLGPMYGEPEIDIIMSSDLYKANVQPGQDGIVNIFGTVRCEMPSYMPSTVYCVVQLNVDAGGWPASNPPALIFSRQTVERTFSATIQVPIETSPDESRDVFISGRWNYSPGAQGGITETESVYVEVLPYVLLAFTSEKQNMTVMIGETGTVTVEIENQGTEQATVTLMVVSDNDLLETEIDKKNMEIPPRQRDEVVISFKQSSGKAGVFTVTLMADDPEHGNPEAIRFSFKVFTKEKGFMNSWTPYLKPLGIAAGILMIGVISVFLFVKINKRRGKSD